MLEFAAIFAGSFTVALSGALMPGPLFTITITESMRRGFSAGPLLMTGHALLEALLVLAVLLGLGSYLVMPSVAGCIALLGGALLIYFGFEMVRTAGGMSLDSPGSISPRRYGRNPVLLGAVASVSNPYWTIWWATIGLGYMAAVMSSGPSGIVAFFLGHISADFAWYSLLSLGFSSGRSLLPQRHYRNLIRACGVFLLLFGTWFLVSAKGFLTTGPG